MFPTLLQIHGHVGRGLLSFFLSRELHQDDGCCCEDSGETQKDDVQTCGRGRGSRSRIPRIETETTVDTHGGSGESTCGQKVLARETAVTGDGTVGERLFGIRCDARPDRGRIAGAFVGHLRIVRAEEFLRGLAGMRRDRTVSLIGGGIETDPVRGIADLEGIRTGLVMVVARATLPTHGIITGVGLCTVTTVGMDLGIVVLSSTQQVPSTGTLILIVSTNHGMRSLQIITSMNIDICGKLFVTGTWSKSLLFDLDGVEPNFIRLTLRWIHVAMESRLWCGVSETKCGLVETSSKSSNLNGGTRGKLQETQQAEDSCLHHHHHHRHHHAPLSVVDFDKIERCGCPSLSSCRWRRDPWAAKSFPRQVSVFPILFTTTETRQHMPTLVQDTGPLPCQTTRA